ncbi:hypothetical protein ACWGPT_00420 [Pseudorhizobium sp. NPDC055634]
MAGTMVNITRRPIVPGLATEGTFCTSRRSHPRETKENAMYSIVWLVGAVVIVIAILNLVGFA